MTTLVPGAAGNLGSRLTRYLAQAGHPVRAMIHRTPLPADLRLAPNVSVVAAELIPQLRHPSLETGRKTL